MTGKAPRGHQSLTEGPDYFYMNDFPKERSSWWSQQASGTFLQTEARMFPVSKPLHHGVCHRHLLSSDPSLSPWLSEPLIGCGHGLDNSLGRLIWAGLLGTIEDRVKHLLVRENNSPREVQRPKCREPGPPGPALTQVEHGIKARAKS